MISKFKSLIVHFKNSDQAKYEDRQCICLGSSEMLYGEHCSCCHMQAYISTPSPDHQVQTNSALLLSSFSPNIANTKRNQTQKKRKKQRSLSNMRNVEYSILLVMSELSTVRCDRALGLWLQARASSVDGQLPWKCCGR